MEYRFSVGDGVRIKEVRGSPRPPAQWLGKRGRILGPVADDGIQETPVGGGRRVLKHIQPEQKYFVEVEGPVGMKAIPESWLAAA